MPSQELFARARDLGASVQHDDDVRAAVRVPPQLVPTLGADLEADGWRCMDPGSAADPWALYEAQWPAESVSAAPGARPKPHPKRNR
jgi:hypothetical protein